MNFLELVKALASETGTELETKVTSVAVPPATSYGETTEHRSRLVRWIQQAWSDIQEDQDQWDFMVQTTDIPLVTGQVVYPIADLVNAQAGEDIYDEIVPFTAPLDYRYIWLGKTVDSQLQLNPTYYVQPEFFFGDRDRYNINTTGVPSRWSIDRSGCIVFDAKPSNDDYHMRFQFKLLPQWLTDDADVPRNLPERYHMLIVYRAMVFYAGFDESQPQFGRASKLYRDMMNKLRLRYLREYSLPGTRS